jgi:multidrug resistance efflux pump
MEEQTRQQVREAIQQMILAELFHLDGDIQRAQHDRDRVEEETRRLQHLVDRLRIRRNQLDLATQNLSEEIL